MTENKEIGCEPALGKGVVWRPKSSRSRASFRDLHGEPRSVGIISKTGPSLSGQNPHIERLFHVKQSA